MQVFGIYRSIPWRYSPGVHTFPDWPVRFSIRLPRPLWILLSAFLIGVLGIGLRFGLPIWRRQMAIWELERIGGRLSVERTGPELLRKVVGDKWMRVFDEVDWIQLRNTSFNDRHVGYLNGFAAVRGIELERTQITDAGVARLEKFRNLEHLSLIGTPITDAGLEHIAKLQSLTELRLDDTRISDVGLQNVGKIRNLNELNVAGTDITDAGLAQLSRLMALRQLTVSRTPVTNDGLQYLTSCKALRHLIVVGTHVTGAGAIALNDALPRVGVVGTIGPIPDRGDPNLIRNVVFEFREPRNQPTSR